MSAHGMIHTSATHADLVHDVTYVECQTRYMAHLTTALTRLLGVLGSFLAGDINMYIGTCFGDVGA